MHDCANLKIYYMLMQASQGMEAGTPGFRTC